MDPVFVRIFERALPYLATRSNDSHARIACQFVVEFLEAEGGDPSVALPAILLHDVGWHVIPVEEQRRAFGPGSSDAALNRRHEIAGARLARTLLEGCGYPRALVDEVCRIVRDHDSRPVADTIEEAVVKDADKIWRVSRVGFPLNVCLLRDLSPQEVYEFIAVRAPRWFITPTAQTRARAEVAARRAEYGLAQAPDIPPPPGDGIGDAVPAGS